MTLSLDDWSATSVQLVTVKSSYLSTQFNRKSLVGLEKQADLGFFGPVDLSCIDEPRGSTNTSGG